MKKNKKNNKSILKILLIIIVCIGIVFGLSKIYNKTTNKDNLKYRSLYKADDSNFEISLYQIDEKTILYAIPNITNGKAIIDNNVITSNTELGHHLFEFNGDNLLILTEDILLKGSYTKVKDITFDEFFELNYGSNKYFDSKYNGMYTDGNMVLKMYQSQEKEVIGFFNELDGEKAALLFSINEEGSIASKYNNKTYMISLADEKNLVLITYDSNNPENMPGVVLQRKNTITKEEVIELHSEY